MTLAGAATAASTAALIMSAVLSGLIVWSGPVDRPRERGAHKRPTPTCGGLGIIAGASLGLLTFAVFAPAPVADLGKIAAALGLAGSLGLLGGLDDLFDLGARIKFLMQIALAVLFAIGVARIEAIPITGALSLPLGPVLGVIGTALWLVVLVNAVNFMDGANGLAPGAVAIVLTALAFAAFAGSAPAIGGAALAASFAGFGFLPWNFPKARLFQGDAGALFSGFLLGELAVIGAGSDGRGAVFVLFVPLALLPFLADVLLTLLARARSGKRLFEAHSEHLYQRWLSANGGSHTDLIWRAYPIMAIYAGCALLLRNAGPTAQIFGFAVGTVLAVIGWRLAGREIDLKRRG